MPDESKKENKLTEKQKRFCHEYIIDYNGSRAARDAGFSKKTCSVIAHEYLRKPNIKAYIDEIKQDIEKECGITKIRNLKELSKIAYSNISNFHDSWIERKEYDQIPEITKSCIESIETKVLKKNIGTGDDPEIVDVEYVKIKLYSKIQALEMINKMLGYNEPDKIKHIDIPQTQITIFQLPDDGRNN